MGRSNSSGGVLHLGPVPASEPVDHWCCLHIKPYWLAIPNKKEDNFLRTMRGFLNLLQVLRKQCQVLHRDRKATNTTYGGRK